VGEQLVLVLVTTLGKVVAVAQEANVDGIWPLRAARYVLGAGKKGVPTPSCHDCNVGVRWVVDGSQHRFID
jgi:hypothetical protein